MSISVLVATYNRAALLAECLAQLARQSFEPGDEVVIVDNGSPDATRAVVEASATGFPVPLRYLVEPVPGKSRALITGIAESRGDILAFTDDDVLVADDWVAVIRSIWREGDVGLAGGRVAPRWSRPAPRWLRLDTAHGYGTLAAPLALLDYGPRRMPLGRRTALGANMAVHRRALQAAGGFLPDLGKLRGTLLSGEDHHLCERVQASGFAAVYDPRLVVRHYVPADRLRLAYHARWFFWSGITNAALDGAGVAGVPAVRRVRARHWAGRIVKGTGRAVAGAIAGRTGVVTDAMADIAFSFGYLAFSRGWTRTGLEPARRVRPRPEAA